jgi:EAL domain-containing protein (putative c-di-GMP-specific phosphodiesterase class I)
MKIGIFIFVRIDNRPIEKVIASGIEDQETARFITDALNGKLIGEEVMMNQITPDYECHEIRTNKVGSLQGNYWSGPAGR